MQATSLVQEADFPVDVCEGDTATPGKGHAFRIMRRESGYHGWFELLNEGQVQIIKLDEISRFEISGGKIGLDVRKWPVPTAVAGLSLLAPFPVLLEAGAFAVAAVTSGFVTPKIRFVCETCAGQYFTGMLTVLGFGAAHTLWQKENRQQTNASPIHG